MSFYFIFGLYCSIIIGHFSLSISFRCRPSNDNTICDNNTIGWFHKQDFFGIIPNRRKTMGKSFIFGYKSSTFPDYYLFLSILLLLCAFHDLFLINDFLIGFIHTVTKLLKREFSRGFFIEIDSDERKYSFTF